MVQTVGFTAARRLLIGKYSQLSRVSSRQHLHWGSSGKIDNRILAILPDFFWKPDGRSPPFRQCSLSVCPKTEMVNQRAEGSQNDCENGELVYKFEELTIPLPWGNLAGKSTPS